MLANIIVQFFEKGGPVMWPILICAFVAVAVVGERAFWWWRESLRRDPQKMEQLLAALENYIWLNHALLIEELRREEDRDAFAKVHHNARRQPF